MSILISAIKNS